MNSHLENGPAASEGADLIPGPRGPAQTSSDVALEARIHRLSTEGASPYTIAAALNAEGLVTAAGKRWHRNSVGRVLWRVQPATSGGQRQPERSSSDPATGLIGRAELLRRGDSLLSDTGRSESLALLVMDIDNFRQINGAFGHLFGDALLGEMADRLRDLATDDDVVARIGGDAFAVLTAVPACDAEAIRLVQRRFGPMTIWPYRAPSGAELTITTTVGVACAAVGSSTAVALLRNAELAMFRASDLHPRWATYQPDLDERSAAGLVQAAALRDAIAAGQVTVQYQPVVDLRTGLAHSVEALVRWQHPERGLVPPAEFLPLAETFGLMNEVTATVVTRVSAQLRDWARAGRSVTCAINLSAPCLTDPECGERLVSALCRLRGSVTVEVVESVIADPAAIDVLERLAAAGVPCAIDDFGTGYSSLGSLKTLPATTLKIDRSLIRDIDHDSRDVEVVRAVVRLAASLDLQVIAEGVETEQAAVRLREAGVQLAQGLWFARPMPAEELERWLDAPPRIAGTRLAAALPEDRHVGEHEVLLHFDDAELLADVARYIGDGLTRQGQAIVVATLERRTKLMAALPAECREGAERDGRLLVLDARETLGLFMRDGAPDPELFDTLIASVVRERLALFPTLRAYGEMTTVLWQEGNVTGALALEDLWNDFQQEVPFPMLCAYPLAHMPPEDGTALGRLCRSHTAARVLSAPARGPDDGADTVNVVLDATRALLRVEAAEHAVGVLIRTVTALGGSTGPAETTSAASLPIDLSLGHADPVLPSAPLYSRARDTLAALLPALVEDARFAASKAERLATLSEQVDTDPLTGLTNRRGLRHARHTGGGDCLAMVDLDLFKDVNDTFGHDAGDRVLVAFSRAARQHLRSTDLVFRLGGDEFLIVLPGTTTGDAEMVIQKLRRHWEAERPFPVTFSAGIAAVVGHDLDESIRAADAALYRSKNEGRNVTGVASP